jgi:hypothetical protein
MGRVSRRWSWRAFPSEPGAQTIAQRFLKAEVFSATGQTRLCPIPIKRESGSGNALKDGALAAKPIQ